VKVLLSEGAFDPWEELRRFQVTLLSRAGKWGAMGCFVGTMRDFNEGAAVRSMLVEHYPGMTERYLERVAEQAHRQWDLLDSLMVHRYGEIQPGEPIVLVATWSAHRTAAFDACRYLVEELKSRAPLWKRERLAESFRWVHRNTPG
jgi:molybdopterin synthase catalytic subunit